MRRAIVHIGRNKTGTSTLQFDLARGRELLMRHGYIYPGPMSQHECLVYHLEPERAAHLPAGLLQKHNQHFQTLEEQIAGTTASFIFSSEGLQNIRPQRLREWLGNTDTYIVIYLREQISYLASSYQQEIKQISTFADFPTWASAFSPQILDYTNFLDTWCAVFGQDRVIVRSYDRMHLVKNDITVDFLLLLGISGFGELIEGRGKDGNPSINGPLLEAKRRINALKLDEFEMLSATYTHLQDLAISYPEYRGRLGIDPNYVRSLRAELLEANNLLARRHLGAEALFENETFPLPSPPSEESIHLATTRLMALVEKTAPEFAARLSARLSGVTSDGS